MFSSIVREVRSRLTGCLSACVYSPEIGANAISADTSAELVHLKKLFDHSSRAARIGVWECNLPGETLAWTDMVYELFDLPIGLPLNREETVKLYTDRSRTELTKLRDRAIMERSGFSLDAEIITAKGNHRWIRITATVECEGDRPVRIFGMKQDITAEKKLFDEIRYLAEFDLLTSLPNRVQFQSTFETLCASETSRQTVVLFLVDLDGFKQVNDRLGHQAGDQCLRVAANCLRSVLDGAELVARIGGDEFAVLHRCGSSDEAARIASSIVAALAATTDENGRHIGIGGSVGVALAAGYLASKDIFAAADGALYAAKSGGRNCFSLAHPSFRSQTHAA